MTIETDDDRDLRLAAAIGDVALVQEVIASGANVNAADRDGKTALHWAVAKSRIEIVRLLIERGANVSAASKHGVRPLGCVIEDSRIDLAKLLIDAGADVNAENSEGGSHLTALSVLGRIGLCRLLLESGAKIVAPGQPAWTPLHAAAHNGHVPICRLLMEYGASPSYSPGKQDWPYLTPFQRAVSSTQLDVVRFFVEECGEILAQKTQDGKTLIQVAGSDKETKDLLRSLKTEISIRDAFPESGSGNPIVKKKTGGMAPI